MQDLVSQNVLLEAQAQKLYRQMTDLQAVTTQHETQIETLLKFNQKLLGIIEKQLNLKRNLKNSDILSLQPISQRTEIQSEMFQSQFTSVGAGAKRLIMKSSLHLKPTPPPDKMIKPIITMLKEETHSLEADQKQVEFEGNKMKTLINEYKKILANKEQFSLSQLSKISKEQFQKLSEIKKQSQNQGNSILQKLSNLKNQISSLEAKPKFIQMLQQVDINQPAKLILQSYITTLKC